MTLLQRTRPDLAKSLPQPAPKPRPKPVIDDRPAWLRRLSQNAKVLA